MELVSRMMDGSIGRPDAAELPPSGAPAKLGQDQKITYLERVHIFEGCSNRQLRAIARIAEVQEGPAGEVLARVADTAVRLLVIHRRDFMTLLREVPALTQQMLVTLCQRVRTAEKALSA